MSNRIRAIAFYLPQYHPIPENDEWWGKGFTEWTNVTKAKPLFKGHYQPHLPADLGFYDLRLPEVREAQAAMARGYGIEGFCYYHYWFGDGRRLLDRPFAEVLSSGKPDFPFCLCWANESWSGIWHGAPSRILMEQTYPGREDNEKHFYTLAPAFTDPRYIKVEGRPVFVVYNPAGLVQSRQFIEQWQLLAAKNGLPGIHFVAHLSYFESGYDYHAAGFDAAVIVSFFRIESFSDREVAGRRWARQQNGGKIVPRMNRIAQKSFEWAKLKSWKYSAQWLGAPPRVHKYSDAISCALDSGLITEDRYPSILPNWDNSPRCGDQASILDGSTPELFQQHVRDAVRLVRDRPVDRRLIFIKSWNEWAEGNYLEPDQKFGLQYLNALRTALTSRC